MTPLKNLLLFLLVSLVLLVGYRFVYYNEERAPTSLDVQSTRPSLLPLHARRPPPPPPPPAPPAGYDYFMLSLAWPNAFCSQFRQRKACDPAVPLPKHQIFTIHGLWPQANNGPSPTGCASLEGMTDGILNRFKDDLLQYWPDLFNADNFDNSKRFWRHEWSKHGTCSSNRFSPADYLRATIALGKHYGPFILSELEERGIKPDGHNKESQLRILNAIKDATGKEAAVTFNQHWSGKSQIFEIRLCFEADGITLKDCKDIIFASAPAPAPAPAPPPPPLPSKVDHAKDSELEDAAELILRQVEFQK